MIAFRARGAPRDFTSRFLAGAVAAVLILAGSANALAQESESPAPKALAPPTPLLPFDPTRRQPEGAGRAADAPSVQGIEINPLAEIDPDTLGVLDSASGGFGPDLWAGVDRARVVHLVGRLPDRYDSAVLRDLAARLLLTRAEPPRRTSEPADGDSGTLEETADAALLALRIDRLAATGDNQGLARLLKIVPRRYDEEPIVRARVDSAMLAGDVTEGCREVRSGMNLYFSLPYWQKAQLYCQIVAGEAAQAQLSLALLSERGLADDPAFQDFIAALSGAQVEIAPGFAATPLHFALLQARGHPLPDGIVEAADLGLLVALAASPKTNPVQRVEAGEIAVALAALEPAILAEAYDRLADDLQADETTREAVTPHGRARLFRAMRRAAGSGAVSQLHAFLTETWSSGADFRAAASVAASQVGAQRPRPEALLLVKPAGRVLYAVGRYEQAGAWMAVAQGAAASGPEAAEAATALWPYWRLSGGIPAVPGGGLATWRESQSGAEPAALDAKAEFLKTALDVFDIGSLPPLGNLAAAGAPASDALEENILAELSTAAASGRQGETLLLALIAMNDGDLAETPPATIGRVLAALVDIGLEPEARALAIERALAAHL